MQWRFLGMTLLLCSGITFSQRVIAAVDTGASEPFPTAKEFPKTNEIPTTKEPVESNAPPAFPDLPTPKPKPVRKNEQHYNVGDSVAVIRNAPIQRDGETVDNAVPGRVLKIYKAEPGRVWVCNMTAGWIDKADLLPVGKKAIDYFAKKVKAAPKNRQWLCAQAYYNAGKGKPDAAIKTLTQLIQKEPTNPHYYYVRAVAWQCRKGKPLQVYQDLSKAIQFNLKQANIHNDRAAVWDKKGDFAKTLAEYKKAKKFDVQLATAYCSRGDHLVRQEKYQQAMTDINKAVQIHSTSPVLFHSRGTAFLKLKKLSQATADYRQAICFDPDTAYLYTCLGSVEGQKGNLETALSYFAKAIRMEPKNTVNYFKRAEFWQNQNKHQKAILDCNRMIQIDPKNEGGYFMRATQWHELGKFQKAVMDVTKAIRLDPKPGYFYVLRGRCWRKLGKPKKAESDFAIAIRLAPKTKIMIHKIRIFAWVESGNFQKGMLELNLAIQHAPKDSSLYILRGFLWAIQGKLQKGLSDFHQAVRLSPHSQKCLRERGKCWMALGQTKKAMADYTTAMNIELESMTEYKDPDILGDDESVSAYSKRANQYHQQKKNYYHVIVLMVEAGRLSPSVLTSQYFKSRAVAWLEQKKYENAIVDFTTAISKKPKNLFLLVVKRAECWSDLRRYNAAIADYQLAIAADPEQAKKIGTHFHLANASMSAKKYDRVVANLDIVIQNLPKNSVPYFLQAKLLACCPDAKYRDGKKAIALATKACQLTNWKEAKILSVLAAGYAETGNFSKAIEWQEKTISLAPEEKKERFQTILLLYKTNKPFRMEE